MHETGERRSAFARGKGKRRIKRGVAEEGAGRCRDACRNTGQEQGIADLAIGERGKHGYAATGVQRFVATHGALVVGNLEVSDVNGYALEPDHGLPGP